MRIAIDGSAVFPKRGTPPECPVGFVHTNDPFIFAPIREACINRRSMILTSGCCGHSLLVYCALDNEKCTYCGSTKVKEESNG